MPARRTTSGWWRAINSAVRAAAAIADQVPQDQVEFFYNRLKKDLEDAVEQEKAWADYLFSQGSVLGLNAQILKDYIEYIADNRMAAIGMESGFNVKGNPLPWMNHYLTSDNVQVAPQESDFQLPC